MNMRKILTVILALLFAMPVSVTFAEDISFSDLPESHWAYSAVMQLVSEGTVSGMGDGTFAPAKYVTRAEFARMIGKTDVKRENDFADLTPEHWGYDYVMWSGIDGDSDNNFRPDEPMLRGDVIYTLWKRAGSPTSASAPSVITKQSETPAAAAWGYTYGLMIGDDGVDLRLDEGISRAEVASIIVRSKAVSEDGKVNFIDNVSDDVLKTVFETSGAFDSAYSPDGKITNGEMARAAMRIASEELTPRYTKYTVEEPFQHKYIKDLYAIGTSCIGTDKITPEFIDANVKNADMVAMLTFALIRKSNEKIVYDTSNKVYSDVSDTDKNTASTCLSYANGNGIQLYSDKTIKPDKESSMRDNAAVLLQLDNLIGTMSYYEVDSENLTAHDISISRDLNHYPENAAYYQCVLSGLPSSVYTTPFMYMNDGANPEDIPKGKFDFARDFRSLFLQLMIRDAAKLKDSGTEVKFTFYPSLVSNNGKGFTVRMKTEIISLGGKTGVKYGDVFKLADGADGRHELHEGMVFYNDSTMPYELGSYPETFITFGDIIAIEK